MAEERAVKLAEKERRAAGLAERRWATPMPLRVRKACWRAVMWMASAIACCGVYGWLVWSMRQDWGLVLVLMGIMGAPLYLLGEFLVGGRWNKLDARKMRGGITLTAILSVGEVVLIVLFTRGGAGWSGLMVIMVLCWLWPAVVGPVMHWQLWRAYRWWLRVEDEGLCAACGYDLRGAGGRCPECGGEGLGASGG